MLSYFTSLLLFLWSLCQNEAAKTLQMVHIVYRHGARAPYEIYPNDPYQLKYWPNGIRQLTQNGMKLEYDLGRFLKKRYVNGSKFIDSAYIHSQVYIRSADVNRCLQSAECQLAGLYPPSGYQVWNKDILWQPVPVHTVPNDKDPLLRPHVNCPRLDEIRKKNMKSAKYISIYEKNEQLISRVSNYTGKTLHLGNFWYITDALIAEKAEKLAKPHWAIDIWDQMIDLANSVFVDRYIGNDELGKLTGGPLLAEITDHMKRWSQKDFTDLFKMNIYSGHDVSLLSLSCALDVPIEVPIFASCIMIELFHSDEGYFVELQYRNDYSGRLHQLTLKECTFRCPLEKFIELTKNRISINREVECGLRTKEKSKVGFFTYYNLKVLLGIFFVLSILLLIIIGVICYHKRSVFFNRFRGKLDSYVTDDELEAFEVYTDDCNNHNNPC